MILIVIAGRVRCESSKQEINEGNPFDLYPI
jgi:hypothetical protein